MSTWVIISWVLVVILTVINVVVFLKLKQASEQMLKMAFPSAKNMTEALGQMQGMMSQFGGMGKGMPGGFGKGGFPGAGAKGKSGAQADQLKAAMDMLQKMQKR